MNNHIMIDIETFGTGSHPVVVSIGWCVFDKENILGSGELFPTLADQKMHGGSLDPDTVMWWLKQDAGATDNQVLAERAQTLEECLVKLGTMIEESDFKGVWAKGVSFDLRILREWYGNFGLDIPWHFRVERCMRTFYDLEIKPVRSEVAHSGEQDAIAQAKSVQKVWAIFNTANIEEKDELHA